MVYSRRRYKGGVVGENSDGFYSQGESSCGNLSSDSHEGDVLFQGHLSGMGYMTGWIALLLRHYLPKQAFWEKFHSIPQSSGWEGYEGRTRQRVGTMCWHLQAFSG